MCESHLKKKSHRSSWIKSLNGKSPKIVILAEAAKKSDLPALEKFFIAKGKFLGWNLTNHTDGGEGTAGFKHTDEAKRKISKSLREQWSAGPRTVFTEEARYKCGASKRGKDLGPRWAKKCAKVKGTPEFKVYDLASGKYIGTYSNISKCSRDLGEFRKTISWALKKDKHVSKKYRFEKVI